MNAYASTFERVEKKYRLSQAQFQAMMENIKERMEPDSFPRSIVSSLYWDTPQNEIISRSLEKPLYKEKLRVRSYGLLQSDGSVVPSSDFVFVELKKKYKGVVYKRRLRLSTSAAKAFLGGMDFQQACALFPLENGGEGAQAPTFKELQVAREIRVFLERHPDARPAMITRCVRTAWKDPGSQLRITFDERVQAGRPEGDPFRFKLARPALNLLAGDQVLMEIKQAGGYPLWLADVLSSYRIYPQSFSKYGTAYQKECLNA